MEPTEPTGGPLTGVRVLDCSRVLSGPICGRMLADLGADVVKVEAPAPDIMRATLPRVGGADGFSAMFAQLNAGKRSLGLDLKASGGPELLGRLAEAADVLLENFRPGVLDKLGLGPASLCERNPRLVYASITGWGQLGSWRSKAAYAPMIHAEAGLLELGTRLRGGAQVGEIQQHADVYAGLMACNAITAALYERERTGRGQHLDICMAEALLYVNEHATAELAEGPDTIARDFDTWTFRSYVLGDGDAVHVLGNPAAGFASFAAALDMHEALADPRFATPEDVAENLDAAVEALAQRLSRVPDLAALEARLAELPLVVIPIRSVAEVAGSAWAADRELLHEPSPGARVVRAPWRSDRSSIGSRGGLAHRGAHNRDVLAEWLGMDAEACAREEALGSADSEPPLLAEAPQRAYRER